MADVAAAKSALQAIWARIRYLARRPAITATDIDCLSNELRTVETGLSTINKYLTTERRNTDGRTR